MRTAFIKDEKTGGQTYFIYIRASYGTQFTGIRLMSRRRADKVVTAINEALAAEDRTPARELA